MITKVSITAFKSVEEVEIDLGNLNVFVGAETQPRQPLGLSGGRLPDAVHELLVGRSENEPANQRVDPILDLAGVLPCAQDCPPPRATTDPLRQVLLSCAEHYNADTLKTGRESQLDMKTRRQDIPRIEYLRVCNYRTLRDGVEVEYQRPSPSAISTR